MAVNMVAFVLITVLCIGASYWLSRTLKLRWWPGFWLRVVLMLLVLLGVGLTSSANADGDVFPVEVLVLDQSESIASGSMLELRSFALAWKNAQPNRHVILFGEDTEFVLSENWPETISMGSNLSEALQLAGNLIGDTPGRVVVATDGNVDNILSVYTQIDKLEAGGNEVSYINLPQESYANDVYVRGILSASTVWEGNSFPAAVQIYSPIDTQATMQIFVNSSLYSENEFHLDAGEHLYTFFMQAGTPGILSIGVNVSVNGDAYPGNNTGYKSLLVYESPDILLVTKNESAVEDLVGDLERENGKVTLISPEELPTNLADLAEYEVVLVHDILARDFSLEQMQALYIHVVEKGRSLVFLGGRNSFTLGGYQGTLFESMLPVELTPPERVERVPVTFILVLDRSGSMAGDRDSTVSPIELTREAAMRALETLRPGDYFGVLTFSGQTNWEANIQQLEDGVSLRLAQDAVSQIIAGGGTLMYQALDEAIAAISSMESTEHLHILLMSDGVSGDGTLDEFSSLVALARQKGISISTIALGYESDPETLSFIAEEGNGRYYLVLNASELPDVMISETKAVQSENVQVGRTNLLLGIENHPALAGFQLNDLPVMDAYIALQSRADRGAEDILVSGNFGDPILSTWQLGLGHVTAWMGDVGENWMIGMQNWEDQGAFWMQFFRYTLPNPSFGRTEVSVVQSAEDLSLVFTLQDENESAGLDAAPNFVVRVGDSLQSYSMTKIAPRQYMVRIPRPDSGAYQGVIQYSVKGVEQVSLAPIQVNYPAELRFSNPRFESEEYQELKSSLINSGLTIEGELAQSSVFAEKNNFDWYYVVLFLVLLSWPAEIAIRRWQMPWRRP